MDFTYSLEKLSDRLEICVTPEHKFGTDAFLLANFANPRHKDMVCDLGTGCGIIPMLMHKNNNPHTIYAVDIQEKAIAQLNYTIKLNNLQDKIKPVLADLKALNLDKGSFDVVTCNPPYKANNSGILNQLSAEQIARHEVLCTIEDVCNTASSLLKFGGKLLICQRPERLADVITAMKNCNIEPKALRFVSKTPKDAPWLFLIEGKKGSKPFLKVLPHLFMYDGEDYSKEIKNIYGTIPK